MLGPKLVVLIGLSLQARAVEVSAVSILQTLETKPAHLAHLEGCYSSVVKTVLPYDTDVHPEGICKKLICGQNGYTIVHTCSKQYVPPGCYLGDETDEPYPHCCKQVICEETYDTYDHYDGVDPDHDDYDVNDDDEYDYSIESDPHYYGPRVHPRPVKYYESARSQPRVRRVVKDYKLDNRGDDYKLDEETTLGRDVKDGPQGGRHGIRKRLFK